MKTIEFPSAIGTAADTENGRYGIDSVLVSKSTACATDGRIAAVTAVTTTGFDESETRIAMIPPCIRPKSRADAKAIYRSNGDPARVSRQRRGKPTCEEAEATLARWPKIQECLPVMEPLDLLAVVKLDANKLLELAKALTDPKATRNAVYLLIPHDTERTIGVVAGDESLGITQGIGAISPMPRDKSTKAEDIREYYERRRKEVVTEIGQAVEAWNQVVATTGNASA